MTAFAKTFFFLRDPNGGVENISDMKAAGFEGVFCNIGDFDQQKWGTIRQRCAQHGMFCGPWSRCDPDSEWSSSKLDQLVAVADLWNAPGIVNAEKGIDGSGVRITTEIAQKVGTRDFAISMEAMPFGNVDWTPVAHLPVLPQNFPAETGRGDTSEQLRSAWWSRGVRCVYITFGTYASKHGKPVPSWYDLTAPYSLYTADDIGPASYPLWSPRATGWQACKKEDPVPPTKDPLTAKQVPYTGPYSIPAGGKRSRGPTAKALKIAMKRMGEEPFVGKDNAELDEHFNAALEAALDRTAGGALGGYGPKRWEAVRALVTDKGEYALNREARELIVKDFAQMNQPRLPVLGPLWEGGKLVLDQDPTHPTSDIDFYIAYDDAFAVGTSILAPEDMEVYKRRTSSNPGKAIYALGASDLSHWLGHLDRDYQLGTTFKRGQFIGKVAPNAIGGGPHVHHGVNIEELFGVGEQLEWGADGDGPDYTHGSPTIREQLEARLLELEL